MYISEFLDQFILTPNERKVLKELIITGCKQTEITSKLGLLRVTVKGVVNSGLRKLQVRGIRAAQAKYIKFLHLKLYSME